MESPLSRRKFFALSGACLAAGTVTAEARSASSPAGSAGGLAAAPDRSACRPPPDGRKLQKAVKIGMVQVEGSLLDKFRLLKELDRLRGVLHGRDPGRRRGPLARHRRAHGQDLRQLTG